MDKKQFRLETDFEKRTDKRISEDYAYKVYRKQVEPYLSIISHWKKDGYTNSDIRKILGINTALWSVFTSMETVQDHMASDGKVLEGELHKELLDSKRKYDNNAKFHEMALKRFDSGYGDKADATSFTGDMTIKIEDATMDDEEIEKKIEKEE